MSARRSGPAFGTRAAAIDATDSSHWRFSRAASNAATRARTLPACSASLRAASSGPKTLVCSTRPSPLADASAREARVNSGIA